MGPHRAIAAPENPMTDLHETTQLPEKPSIPPGKVEEPVPMLVARWMLLGCGATIAVLAVALLFWTFVVIRGVAQ